MDTMAVDLNMKGTGEAISAKTVAYDFHWVMEGATKLKCSEFEQAIIKLMGQSPHSQSGIMPP